ncbi:MAG: hypothetical protein HY240_08585 [Actinobacteria bacterium]|nr:hypothetical protein [Actinomycetota bacterium]
MALSERDRKLLTYGGGAAGGLVVLFLLFNLFFGGGGEPSPTFVPGGGGHVPSTGSPTTQPSVVLSFGGNDPFEIPAAFITASPSSSSSTSNSPSPTPTAPGGGSSYTTSDGKVVAIIDVFTQNGVEKAQIDVDGVNYTRKAGQTFAGNFQLVSISGTCVSIDYGDESFTICTNPQK